MGEGVSLIALEGVGGTPWRARTIDPLQAERVQLT